jgi:hypothetical protein
MYGTERPNIFKMLPKESWSNHEEEENEEKIYRVYLKMKKWAIAREKRHKRGNAEWKPELCEEVLVKTQPMSNAVRGITSKYFICLKGHIGLVKF